MNKNSDEIKENMAINEINETNIGNLVRDAKSWKFLTGISIDDSNPSINWTAINSTYDWCNGKGTKDEPYIIENITIDAGGSGSCLTIQNSIVYFIIRNCTFYNSGSVFPNAGIYMYNVNNGTLVNNTCSRNNFHGIYLRNCDKNEILNNTANDNAYRGIWLDDSDYNNVTGNIANGNSVSDPTGYQGIWLSGSSTKNQIINNTLKNNPWGISIEDGNMNLIYRNTIIYTSYIYGGTGIYLLSNSKNNITKNEITGASISIYLSYSHFNNVTANIINGGSTGIRVASSDDNFVSGNNITTNYNGIEFESGSDNNNITGNFMHYGGLY
ncbi:MAG: hypothetical protein EU548_10185, partial [Promethearchaeota archaeon]